MKKQIPCKLDKCDKQEFLSMFDAGICDVNDQVASTVTARYYKGIGAHHDNMVIEIEADEQKEKQILDTILLKDEAKTAGGSIVVSPALLQRDYKGWNTYGMAAVVEWYV